MNTDDLMLFSDGTADGSDGGAGEETTGGNKESDAADKPDKDAKAESGQAAMPAPMKQLLTMLADDYGSDTEDPQALTALYNQRKMRSALEERLYARKAADNYKQLSEEAKTLSEKNGDFILDNELKNPVFVRLVNIGFGIEEAWKAVHADGLMEKAVFDAEQRGEAKAASLLRSGSLRPDENGMREQGGISRRPSVENLTGGSIRDILRRVENGAKVKF